MCLNLRASTRRDFDVVVTVAHEQKCNSCDLIDRCRHINGRFKIWIERVYMAELSPTTTGSVRPTTAGDATVQRPFVE